MGNIWTGGSSSLGELSSDSASGEESKFWVKRFCRLICHIVG